MHDIHSQTANAIRVRTFATPPTALTDRHTTTIKNTKLASKVKGHGSFHHIADSHIIKFILFIYLFIKSKRTKRPLTLQCDYIQTHNTIKLN